MFHYVFSKAVAVATDAVPSRGGVWSSAGHVAHFVNGLLQFIEQFTWGKELLFMQLWMHTAYLSTVTGRRSCSQSVTHSRSHSMGNMECAFFDCGGTQRADVGTGRTCKLQTERPGNWTQNLVNVRWQWWALHSSCFSFSNCQHPFIVGHWVLWKANWSETILNLWFQIVITFLTGVKFRILFRY